MVANHTDLIGKFQMTSPTNAYTSNGALAQSAKAGSVVTTQSRFIPIEKLGLCTPIGQKVPLDKPKMKRSEIKKMDVGIVPIFKDFDEKGLSKASINKAIG